MGKNKVILFHPGGSAMFVQQTARAYHEAGMLDRFFLTFAHRPQSFSGKALRSVLSLSSKNPDAELKRRMITEVPDEFIVTRPFWEIMRTVSGKSLGPIITDFLWEHSEHDFCRFVAGKLTPKIDAVHGYEHGSLEVFQKARKMGIKTIYEMPAPFHKTTTRILEAEYQKFPKMVTVHKKHTDPLTPRRNQRREEELVLSDVIVCNSSFTADSLVEGGADRNKIIVVHYGIPKIDTSDGERPPSDKTIFLYAGTLSVRKGVHYLLDAWKKLNPPSHVELRMFGSVNIPEDLLKNLPGKVTISGTIPRAAIYSEYRKAHILLFPTLCDGFGMVLTESLSNGCPILATRNAGASDFIKDSENGFIVPAGSSDAILERMRWCVQNPDKLLAMRENCLQTARTWQWEDYRKSLVEKITAASCL